MSEEKNTPLAIILQQLSEKIKKVFYFIIVTLTYNFSKINHRSKKNSEETKLFQKSFGTLFIHNMAILFVHFLARGCKLNIYECYNGHIASKVPN